MMRAWGLTAACLAWSAATASAGAAGAPVRPVVVDAFESTAEWTAQPASGVLMRLSGDAGARGRALRVDFDFQKGGGYAVAHRAVDLDLPENYRFVVRMRGECLPQTLEFKLIDASGENVWWVNRRDVTFDPEWREMTFKKRHVTFAWGPLGGGEIRHVAAIEFAITAGSGGQGTVWLDELELQPLPPPDTSAVRPVARASSSGRGRSPALAVDGDPATAWESRRGDRAPWFELDLGSLREFGGVVLDWVPGRGAADYVVELSAGAGRWRAAREVADGDGGRDALDLPESEARRVRVRVLRAEGEEGVALASAEIRPLEWAATPSAFFEAVAREAPRGRYPRSFTGEQAYWTVIGVDGASEEALIGEDGAIETGRGAYSVEPFLLVDGRLVTWADVRAEQALEDDCLPLPSVRWRGGPLDLDVVAFADGPREASTLLVRYRVRNPSDVPVKASLALALRPFQVNPPMQFMGTPGGVSRIGSVALEERRVVRVNGARGLICARPPTAFGATTFERGDVVDHLAAGRIPPAEAAEDALGRASAVLAYELELPPGRLRDVEIAIPLAGLPADPESLGVRRAPPDFDLRRDAAVRAWRATVANLGVDLPPVADSIELAIKAQIGWVLVNRDGGAIQPGSRAYERSWIRDGSLTSAALLRLGHPGVVREFLEWFAPYQYADGKVPCCVDRRGSDPVPEHDSHGEFIFLVAEYLRLTGDRETPERLWPHVRAAAAYLDTLRATRRTPEWRAAGREAFFGLLPPSISHEGYSAKPMHSYWDDLFALRGYRDAAWLAGVLGHREDAAWLAAARDTFTRDLAASVRAAMAAHGIDYVPGCADLGDFDATSTTIALNPVQAGDVLPPEALRATFDRYWTNFGARRDGEESWDVFTPYEWRNVGALARLGMRERANQALDWLMRFRRPPGFQHWAEVVDREARRPRFIGDMPHTWCGSDFVRSVLDLVAYEREPDSALVLAAGVPWGWLAGPGVRVRAFPTRWGPLTYDLQADGDHVVLRVEGLGLTVPSGGIVLAPPVAEPDRAAGRRVTRCLDARAEPAPMAADGSVVVRALPAEIHWDTRPGE